MGVKTMVDNTLGVTLYAPPTILNKAYLRVSTAGIRFCR